MIESGYRAGFPFESLAELLGGDVNGHVAAEPGIACAVDLPHTAGANERKDLVWSQLSPDGQGHISLNDSIPATNALPRSAKVCSSFEVADGGGYPDQTNDMHKLALCGASGQVPSPGPGRNPTSPVTPFSCPSTLSRRAGTSLNAWRLPAGTSFPLSSRPFILLGLERNQRRDGHSERSA